jgi:hypothetical protein
LEDGADLAEAAAVEVGVVDINHRRLVEGGGIDALLEAFAQGGRADKMSVLLDDEPGAEGVKVGFYLLDVDRDDLATPYACMGCVGLGEGAQVLEGIILPG